MLRLTTFWSVAVAISTPEKRSPRRIRRIARPGSLSFVPREPNRALPGGDPERRPASHAGLRFDGQHAGRPRAGAVAGGRARRRLCVPFRGRRAALFAARAHLCTASLGRRLRDRRPLRGWRPSPRPGLGRLGLVWVQFASEPGGAPVERAVGTRWSSDVAARRGMRSGSPVRGRTAMRRDRAQRPEIGVMLVRTPGDRRRGCRRFGAMKIGRS